MGKILLIVFVVVCFSVKGQDIDVLHYSFALEVNDKTDSIKGEAGIKFVRQNMATSVSFDLAEIANNGKGMKVVKASIMYHNEMKISFTQKNNKVIIELPSSEKRDTLTLYIMYTGIPADGLIISKNKYGDRTFFTDNWPDRAHQWIPCVDKPYDKATFEFMVFAPPHYRVVSNGIKKEEFIQETGMKLTHWKEDTPLPTKVMAIGVAKFATKTYDDSPKDIPVSAWVYPQDSTKGFYDYAITPGIVKFFADYIGPFPYKKLANVQSKTIFGGMENASCIFYAENSITGDRSKEDLMAHEIAHQWFGDMVSEKSFAHLWLSEGFADYFEHYYFEKKYGEEAARKKWEEAREEVIAFALQSRKAVVDSTEDLMSLLNANSYKKGAWVLRMLRNEVGDSVFHNIIRTYYNQYKGGNAETRDFEAVAEKVSGKELTWFFEQWLYQEGIPRLAIKKKVTEDGTQLVIEQQQKNLYQFTLPVNIQIATLKGKPGYFKISERTTVLLVSKDKSARITIDPSCSLLFEAIKK